MIGHDGSLTRKPSSDQAEEIRGDLLDVSGFSLRDLNELDNGVLAEELRRLLGDGLNHASASGGFSSGI